MVEICEGREFSEQQAHLRFVWLAGFHDAKNISHDLDREGKRREGKGRKGKGRKGKGRVRRSKEEQEGQDRTVYGSAMCDATLHYTMLCYAMVTYM